MQNDILWAWPELCEALGMAALDGPDVHGIDIDSRRLSPGDLFVALPGDPGPRFQVAQRSARDGHDYLDAAFAAGAVGALVHRETGHSQPCLRVDDTLDALWALGRAARARTAARVAAVTGSSGKTTVKTFLAEALDAFATPGSLNNHLGLPLSLARTPTDAGFAVYEIGTNHPGEIAPLATLARPDVAVVLNVHPAHIAHFADLEALRREKLSIADGLEPGGTLVCLDTLDRSGIDASTPVLTFGESSRADVRLAAFDGASALLATPSGTFEAEVPGGGNHRAMSLAAAAATLVALGEEPQRVARIREDAVPAGRGNRIPAGGVTLIDDSYNANPASMAAALRALAAERPDGGRTVALLGEMLELGAGGERLHADLAPSCAGIDRILCVGAGMEALHVRLPAGQRLGFVATPDEVDVDAVAKALAPGDIVLLKGSNRVFWARGFAGTLRDRLAARTRQGAS